MLITKTESGRYDVLVYNGDSNEKDLSGFKIYVGQGTTLSKDFTQKYYCDISIPQRLSKG